MTSSIATTENIDLAQQIKKGERAVFSGVLVPTRDYRLMSSEIAQFEILKEEYNKLASQPKDESNQAYWFAAGGLVGFSTSLILVALAAKK